MTERTPYLVIFTLLLLLEGWGSKASSQFSGATYAVRCTLPKGASDLRCVTYLSPKDEVVVTSECEVPTDTRLTFAAAIEADYEIGH